jgi:NitT/TauT family transport system permease protein
MMVDLSGPESVGAVDGDLGLDVADKPALPTPQASPRWRRVGKVLLGPVVVFAASIGIWYLVCYFVLAPSRRFMLPPPQTVINTAFLQGANLKVLLSGLAITTEIAMVSLAFSIVFGIGLAILMSESKHIERGFYPYLVISQTVPILALVPLIGFWLGFGFTARAVVCILIAFFPITANALYGLTSYPATYEELFDLHQVGRLTKLRKLKLPTALPAIFTGLRIAAGLVVVGEIVGGFYFQQGPPDLGALLDEFIARLNGPMLFGAIILASALGVAVFWAFSALSAVAIGRWKE